MLVFLKGLRSLQWPDELKDEWSLLLQCRLVGKAQKIYQLCLWKRVRNYEAVKTAIIRAYDLVPEAYRQNWNHKRCSQESYVEFASDEKAFCFDK